MSNYYSLVRCSSVQKYWGVLLACIRVSQPAFFFALFFARVRQVRHFAHLTQQHRHFIFPLKTLLYLPFYILISSSLFLLAHPSPKEGTMRLTTVILTISTFITLTFGAKIPDNDAVSLTPRAASRQAPLCTSSSPHVCPSCDGQAIRDASGALYTVHCDSLISSSKMYVLEGTATHRQCMAACDESEGCWGVFASGDDGHCEVAVGAASRVASRAGFVAFVRATVAGSTSSSAARTSKSKTFVSTKTAVAAIAATSSSSLSSECAATAITCPHCDNKILTDHNNKRYRVYCDNQLFATSDYNLQQWTTPAGCLAACDNVTWCAGTTFWPQGNCQLAKGGSDANVFPQEMPGYTAFLPVASSSKAPPTSPSRYPSDSGYSVATTVTNPAFANLATATPTAEAQSCAPPNATCPRCDGRVVQDDLSQTYR